MLKNLVIVVLSIYLGCSYGFSQNSPDEIKSKIQEYRDTGNFTEHNKEYIDLLVELGNALKYSKTDTVKSLAVESLELSRHINYVKGEFESLLNFGYFELYTGNPDKATFYYTQTLEGALLNQFKNLAIKSYNGIAQAHFIRAEYADAFTNFQNALELAEEINDSEMIIKMGANLGTLFSILEDYDEALKYYKIAQSEFNENTTVITKVSVLVNLGYLNNRIKQPKKAMDYLDESIDLLQHVDAAKILAFAYLTKGDVLNQTEQYYKALSFFNKAFKIYAKVNDKKGEADLYLYSGNSHTKLNNFESAEKSFLKSLALYKSFNLKSGLEKSYRALYELNKKKAFTSKALAYLELAQAYSDSVSKEKQRSTISMMNAKLAYEKNKELLKTQNEKELNDRRKHIIWISTGLIASILISLVVFRATTTKKRLNKELTVRTTILSKKQDELNKLNANQDKLFSIVGHDLRDPILSLKKLLGESLEKNKEIKNFYAFGPKLKKDVDHIHFTLDNLLNWGLTQMKGNATKQENLIIKQRLQEIVDFFTEDLDKKNISLELLTPDHLELMVDPDHFTIIFRNLISNAIKFTPINGTICIETSYKDDYVTIAVKDSGVGISTDAITKIFDNKEHFTTIGTNNERGTGLGLILCAELIEKNKGFIVVESELTKGSVFSVHFGTNTNTS
ncbi:tetratricopeptide repeat protein [Maribacter chungangensis]|uniref:histidine kinase n=1 Tax=Maribacter chungangensis TaxID=1069117 RepID=A0ABW3B4M5_9FLAO